MDERDTKDVGEPEAHHGGNGAAHPPSARELVEQGERIGHEIASLADAARQAAFGWEDVLRERLRERPYATLAVAAAVGYVLGGGLPTGLIRLALALSGRAALDHLLSQLARPTGR